MCDRLTSISPCNGFLCRSNFLVLYSVLNKSLSYFLFGVFFIVTDGSILFLNVVCAYREEKTDGGWLVWFDLIWDVYSSTYIYMYRDIWTLRGK